MNETQLNELERRLEYPTHIKNGVEIPGEDGKTIVYVGQVECIHFNSRNEVNGKASLSKFERIEGTKTERVRTSWIPSRHETKVVPYKNEILIWTFDTGCGFGYENTGLLVNLGSGTLTSRYKDEIKVAAANSHIGLSDRLMDLVFGPIDARILEIYNDFRGRQ